jgi:glycosyltransferase involved in cell wall biosynthesis
MSQVSASLIISVYKNVKALRLILKSLEKQRFKNFEVIIAEDNDGAEMKAFIEVYSQKSAFPILHLSQPDRGFLKNKALNRAVVASSSPYLIFIDGDCVLHPHFIREHVAHQEKNRVLFGRRVLLSSALTNLLYSTENLNLLRLAPLLFSGSKRIEEALYLPFIKPKIRKKSALWGCNWSIDKQSLLDINGFDEDYTLPGFGEDTDVEFRLLKRGFKLKRMKYHAIQYHLFHPLNYQDTVAMKALMQEKMNAGMTRCINGLDQYR